MKKLILSIAATSAVAISGHAQQLLFTDAGANSTDTTINGVANNTTDLNLELLVGSTSTTVTTDVVTLLLNGATASATTALGTVQPGQGDIVATGGDIYDGTGNTYVVPAGTAWAQILAWTGNYSSYAAAVAAGQGGAVVDAGISQIFQILPPPIAGNAPATLDNIENTGDGNIDLKTVVGVVPEPSTLAMAGVGLASMLIFRRKSK
jgi:hypothetical protein